MVQLDIQLTEHFTLRELCDSETARRQKLPNIPGPGHIMKLKNLLTKSVEPARRHFGVPFRITSGYRCEAVNRMVGGVSTSQHLRGEAVDFTLILPQTHEPLTLNHAPLTFNHAPLTLRHVFDWMAANVPYDQLIWEHGRWIHVSLHIDPRLNRHQVVEYR